MRTIIIYSSQTGFTERYAKWLAEELQANTLTIAEAQKKPESFFDDYETIIYGGYAMAGTIHKVKWFQEHIDKWKGKKLAAYCVGGSPIENPEVEKALNSHFGEAKLARVQLFYCPGGFNYEKMNLPSKAAMKMFVKMLKNKKDKTEEEKKMVEMVGQSYDISDKKYIEPILEYLKNA